MKIVYRPSSIVHRFHLFAKCALVLTMVYGLWSIVSCNSPYTANPRGYFQVEFPKKQYRLFDQPGYPYSFEYPVYSNVIKDSTFFGEETENPWWINIDFPQFRWDPLESTCRHASLSIL